MKYIKYQKIGNKSKNNDNNISKNKINKINKKENIIVNNEKGL